MEVSFTAGEAFPMRHLALVDAIRLMEACLALSGLQGRDKDAQDSSGGITARLSLSS